MKTRIKKGVMLAGLVAGLGLGHSAEAVRLSVEVVHGDTRMSKEGECSLFQIQEKFSELLKSSLAAALSSQSLNMQNYGPVDRLFNIYKPFLDQFSLRCVAQVKEPFFIEDAKNMFTGIYDANRKMRGISAKDPDYPGSPYVIFRQYDE